MRKIRQRFPARQDKWIESGYIDCLQNKMESRISNSECQKISLMIQTLKNCPNHVMGQNGYQSLDYWCFRLLRIYVALWFGTMVSLYNYRPQISLSLH